MISLPVGTGDMPCGYGKTKQSDTSFDDLENSIQDEYDLEKLYIIEERKITVHRALRNLNTEYKQVLWLPYLPTDKVTLCDVLYTASTVCAIE